MKTMTQMLREKLAAAAVELFEECRSSPPSVRVEISSDPKFGDYSTNLAMQLAPVVKDGPLRIAHKLSEKLGDISAIRYIEIVEPGFLNIRVSPSWLGMQVRPILEAGSGYGGVALGNGQRVLVEFISANPTGPLHLGNGRGAFIGDTVAHVLELAQFKPFREFYVNDIGNQVNILAESVIRRSLQIHGINVEYPENLYQGEYVKDIGRRLNLEQYKLKSTNALRDRIKGRVLNIMIRELQRVIENKLHVSFDRWFRESELYNEKIDEKVLEVLREKGLAYEHQGALWFKTTSFGDEKDRVLVKSDNEKTYFLSDVALRWNRFVERRFDREVVVLGADHHGYVGRLTAAVAALGYPGALEVILVQLVRLRSHGQEVKMSKRAGTYVTLEELIDEVGSDVARFFFLMHAPHTHMDFDLDLAQDKSEKNPVYYVQYAHARICSIVKKAKGLRRKRGGVLREDSSRLLIKQLLRLPDLVEEIAVSYHVHKLPFYAMELATAFHNFYDKVRVIDNGVVDEQRLDLIQATKVVLANTLTLMGVSAPERMQPRTARS